VPSSTTHFLDRTTGKEALTVSLQSVHVRVQSQQVRRAVTSTAATTTTYRYYEAEHNAIRTIIIYSVF